MSLELAAATDSADAAVKPDLAEDVLPYCRHNGLSDLLDQAVALAKSFFPSMTRLQNHVRFDPDSDDDWVILKATVRGQTAAVLDAYEQYAARWAGLAPPDKRFRVRLSCRAV